MKTINVNVFKTADFIEFVNSKFDRKLYNQYNYYGNVINFYENVKGNINNLDIKRVERGDVTNLYDVINYMVYRQFLKPGSYLIQN
jgi:hypothetical protein